jgi:hypothetical protein
MKTQTTIPAGYRISITSWENDGDNYKTEVLEGLTKERVKLYTDICKALYRNYGKMPRIANLYEPTESELEAFNKVMLKVRKANESEFDKDTTDEETMQETMYDIASDLGLVGSEFFSRVCESFKVEYINTPIVLHDVTDEFK